MNDIVVKIGRRKASDSQELPERFLSKNVIVCRVGDKRDREKNIIVCRVGDKKDRGGKKSRLPEIIPSFPGHFTTSWQINL